MYDLHLNMVLESRGDVVFDTWVLYLNHDSGTQAEKFIDSKHKEIETALFEENVDFSEITSMRGKQEVYKKFKLASCKFPIFLIFNKPPRHMEAGDRCLVIEWGKWTNPEIMKGDVMALTNFFSDKTFREHMARSQSLTKWEKTTAFLKENAVAIAGLGFTIATAAGG
jgi:hypothetical protein